MSASFSYATQQIYDSISYQGESYYLESSIFEQYFAEHPESAPEKPAGSNLVRVYKAEFTIQGYLLVLDDIREMPHNNKDEWTSFKKTLFPRKQFFHMDWFSGVLVLKKTNKENIVTKVLLLEMNKGMITKKRELKQKQITSLAETKVEDLLRIPKFTEMGEGDRIHLFFEHGSCLGIKDDNGTGYVYTSGYMVPNGQIVPDKNEYTSLKLTIDDKMILDDLLAYWRGDIDTYGCTASEILKVTYVSNGEIIQTERYVDSTGDDPPVNPWDVFARCIDRKKKKQEQNKPNQNIEPMLKTPAD